MVAAAVRGAAQQFSSSVLLGAHACTCRRGCLAMRHAHARAHVHAHAQPTHGTAKAKKGPTDPPPCRHGSRPSCPPPQRRPVHMPPRYGTPRTHHQCHCDVSGLCAGALCWPLGHTKKGMNHGVTVIHSLGPPIAPRMFTRTQGECVHVTMSPSSVASRGPRSNACPRANTTAHGQCCHDVTTPTARKWA